MNDLPRQKLRELIARHGNALGQDARRCKGLLSDYCAAYRREVAVLTMAVEEHVPTDLLAAPTGTPREVVRARLGRRLCDNLALSEPAARWAVDSWALALELVTETELAVSGPQLSAPPPGVPPSLQPRTAPSQPSRLTKAPLPAAMAPAAPRTKPIAKPSSAPQPQRPPAPPSAAALPAEIVVAAQGAGDYASITEALRRAAPGARIRIRPGRYDESLVIDRPVILFGDGRPTEIIITSATASCVRSEAAQATVSNLTLHGRGEQNGAAFFAIEVAQGKLLLDQCDITSDTLSCVAVHGAATQASLQSCRIRDGADSGVYVFDGAQATLDTCDLYGHANIGVAVTGGARVSVKGSHIHDGQNAGLVAWQQGSGLIEASEIYGNRLAGVGVSEGGTLTARACRIYRGENSGVYVHDGGEAKLEHCDIFEHRMAEVAVTTRGNLAIHDSQMHDGEHCGIFLGEEGQALVQESGMHGNALSGVLVGAGASAAIHHCQINDNRVVGINVAADGAVNVEDSDLTGNDLGPWEIEEGAIIESERNRE